MSQADLLDFEVVIDSALLELLGDVSLTPCDNKRVMSILNGFEDGAWRFERFQNFIWDNVAETALSHREREALRLRPHTLLVEAARNLRITDSDEDISKGSELAEIVLYGIMKHKYNALPVVPKIFYKQNTQDNAKGADSVHIVLEGDGDFSLWFGEAKFYNSIEDARLNPIVQSIKNSLMTDKLKKENSIITNLSDLDSIEMNGVTRENIKAVLRTGTSMDDIKPKLVIPILILHECDITASASALSGSYVAAIRAHHAERAVAYFSKQVSLLATEVHKYEQIRFCLILFPVPKKSAVVDAFVKTVQNYRG